MKFKKIDLPINILLIIECCKEKPCSRKIEEYIENINNWDEFIFNAKCHGVLPIVYNSLKNVNSMEIPSSVLLKLRKIYFDIAKENILLTSELINIVNLLDKHDIKYIAFKGPSLSHMAYGDITLRQYCDLDILIDIENLDSFSNLLIKNKYTTDENIIFLKNKFFISIANDFSFFSKSNVHIELHWNLFRQVFHKESQKIDIWNNINKIKINKSMVNTINNELLFVYLCIHGSKHLWERIEWLVDLNKLIMNNNLDWDIIKLLSKKLNVDNMLNLGLLLVSELFFTKLPLDIEKRFKNKDLKLKRKILDLYKHSLFFKEGNINGILYKVLTISLLKNSNIDRIKYLISIIFKPSQYDVYFLNLHNSFRFLYYFIRPYRFIHNKIFKK